MRAISILITTFCCCANLAAQVTPGKLLASAWDDPTVLALREQQAYLAGHNFKLPLLRQVQVRTETRDWDPKQQEYALRLNTNTPRMKRTQAGIHAAMKSLTEAERLELVQEALAARYELIVDAHFAEGERALLLRQKKVLTDKRAVYGERLKLGLENDLDDYFRAEEDLLEAERRLDENSRSKPNAAFLVGVFTGTEDSLQAGGALMSIPMLLNTASLSTGVLPPSAKREQARAELAALEAELERRDGRNHLSYLQFGYTGNANDPTRNRFKVGAGVNLPWPNASALQVQERELRALQARTEAEAEQQAASQAGLLRLHELKALVERLVFIEEQQAKFAEGYDPVRLHGSGLDNPETLLRVQEALLRLEGEALAVRKDIYQAYVALLADTGLLTQEPARNWLSPGLDLIAR
jgi:hypothetical protein